MIDQLVIRIPLSEKLCFVPDDGQAQVDMNRLSELGVKLQAKEVSTNPETGEKCIDGLTHPYESIPSSSSTVAIKIFNANQHTWPFLEVKASPAKALQGHNLFGFECIATGAQELLESVYFAYPDLYKFLDWHLSEVVSIDCTFFARFDNPQTTQQVLDFLKSVSSGQTRISKKSHDTTAYWGIAADGKQSGRHKSLKVYLKHAEFMSELNDLRHKATRSKLTELQKYKLSIMDNPELIEFSKNMLRLEATIQKRMMKRLGIPTLLTELIGYQKRYDVSMSHKFTLIQALHKEAFKDIFKAIGKKTMKLHNDDDVLNGLKSKFFIVTKTGKTSYTKANKLFGIYRTIKAIGFEETSKGYSRTTFFRHVTDLESFVSKAQLQNMHGTSSNVVSFVRFVEIDFNNQVPLGYVPPKSQLSERYKTNIYKFAVGA